jgi:hypothetical protein
MKTLQTQTQIQMGQSDEFYIKPEIPAHLLPITKLCGDWCRKHLLPGRFVNVPEMAQMAYEKYKQSTDEHESILITLPKNWVWPNCANAFTIDLNIFEGE